MRLKCVKLAGFKSFVDPTTVSFPGNLTAIVGPNGCGKSNVIDAVRWVMGESSARQLRGELITDVIFNGSASRKPTMQASIELIFDNTSGRVKGQYAQVAEIAIRRQVARDGQSAYFINGTRCRRRDIQDIFLGTGLGPRSYSIIEQGVISNLIEAKPEELRAYLEEAAGISRYKERRRETENRIRHTKENLERLSDLREELERQLARLQRQAKAAEQYRELKAEEQRLRSELLALRWQAWTLELDVHTKTVGRLELKREASLKERTKLLARLETGRVELAALTDATNTIQQQFYETGAAIARLEEGLQAREQRGRQLEADAQQAVAQQDELRQGLEQDGLRIAGLAESLAEVTPRAAAAKSADDTATQGLEAAEAAMTAWQQDWDNVNQEAAEPRRRTEVESLRIVQFEQSLDRVARRLERLDEGDAGRLSGDATELNELEVRAAELEVRIQTLQAEVVEAGGRLVDIRSSLEEAERHLAEVRGEIQVLTGRQASLEALQESALGRSEEAAKSFLAECGLDRRPRLGERLRVQPGWEVAVEVVLEDALRAVVVEQLDAPAEAAQALEDAELALFETTPAHARAPVTDVAGCQALAAFVTGDDDLSSFLHGYGAAENLLEALALRARLEPGECIVCRDGTRVGRHWVRIARGDAHGRGVLRRGQELETLHTQISKTQERAGALEQVCERLRHELGEQDGRRQQAQDLLAELVREQGDVHAEWSARQARLEEASAHSERIEREREELAAQRVAEDKQLAAARSAHAEAVQSAEKFEQQCGELLARRDALREALEKARREARSQREAAYEIALRQQNLANQLESARAARARLEGQHKEVVERLAQIQALLAEQREPLGAMHSELETALARRLEVERELTDARQRQAGAEEGLRELELERNAVDTRVQQAQDELEAARMQHQEIEVRRRALEEQLAGVEAPALLATMPEDATEDAWVEALAGIDVRIARLGPINLAAVEEYAQQSERKTYLDAQNADLVEALETLEGAIRKIDRETRSKFKATFDQVNRKLQVLFPKLFGGGHANLELTGDDLLDTGVAIMARPPGKQNASIHQLSGGEKALVAIALVFAIFDLNPAPFCMLDEVDAPLDDANVARYCRLVTDMAKEVQFIYVTHNKIAMEMGQHLMGVTMQEAGVSRLVTVDVEHASALATG